MKIKVVSNESVKEAVEYLEWAKAELVDIEIQTPEQMPSLASTKRWIEKALLELQDETIQGG